MADLAPKSPSVRAASLMVGRFSSPVFVALFVYSARISSASPEL
jgi:hypothetical protein